MKKIILSALAVGSVCVLAGHAAQAASNDDVRARLTALEKENASIRRENAALLENKKLRERNARLKSPVVRSQPQASVSPVPVVSQNAFDAYAALPVRREQLETRGQFRFWGEGGAFWSGGDSVASSYSLTDFSGLGGLLGGGGGGNPGIFDLTPKVGWEAAAGFDYRFANSPWHISGQFRYGEGGKTNGSASSAGTVDPAILAALGGNNNNPFVGATIGGSQDIAASYNETHWLADIAVGRDVIGAGPEAMQLKAGIRIAELVGTLRRSNNSNTYLNFAAPVDLLGIGAFSSYSFGSLTDSTQRDSFLGVGPRIGIEGSLPFADRWSFDYLGDAAVLFGNQKQVITSTTASVYSPALLALLAGGGGTSAITRDQRYSTVFNADIQVGVSYWLTHNVKLSASYRLDAFVNATDDTTGALPTVNRYIHGPHLGVSGMF